MAKTIKLSKLVTNDALYPRNGVDDSHVMDLVRALQSGAVLPPIVVDKDSMTIVDGYHRRAAHLKHQGEDAEAEVVFRQYTDERALFIDAVRLNSAHGRKLDRHDQTRIVLKLREMGVADHDISITLHVPEPTVQTLSVRIVMTAEGPLPSKRGAEHLAGQTLEPAQVEALQSVRSAEAGRLCLELSRLLEHRLVDLDNSRTVEQLRQLQAVIAAALESVGAAA